MIVKDEKILELMKAIDSHSVSLQANEELSDVYGKAIHELVNSVNQLKIEIAYKNSILDDVLSRVIELEKRIL